MNLRERRFTATQRKYAEVWQENETSIVIKMLDQSMKERDAPRTMKLQRSLLRLEGRAQNVECEGLIGLLPKCVQNFTLAVDVCAGSESVEGGQFTLKETEYLEKAILQNTKQYDHKLNVLLIGDAGVGKTSLMNVWLGVKDPLGTVQTHG